MFPAGKASLGLVTMWHWQAGVGHHSRKLLRWYASSCPCCRRPLDITVRSRPNESELDESQWRGWAFTAVSNYEILVMLVFFDAYRFSFSPTAEALGSSAIVRFRSRPEQLQNRFPQGSQVKVPKVPKVPSRFPQGSQKVPTSPSRFLQGSLQGSQVFQVKVVKVPKIIM